MFDRFDKLLILASALVAGAVICVSVQGQSPAAAKARWVYLAQTVMEQPDSVPDEPVSDECENCGGTGKLGDGTIERICPVCDGTGKKTTAKAAGWPPKNVAVQAPAKHNLIEVHTASWCGACQRWKQEIMPTLTALGWEVVEVGAEGARVLPSFRLWINGKSTFHSGWMSNADLSRMKTSLAGSSSTVQLTPRTTTTNYSEMSRDRAPLDWSWPSNQTISYHLSQPPHNLSIAKIRDLGYRGMVNYHNQVHERHR